jgi:serine phosphatase RsbU (regulator of sigma subunit)
VGYRDFDTEKSTSDRRYQDLTKKDLEDLIHRTFSALSLPDGDRLIGEYLITKMTTTVDITGGDYVAIKEVPEISSDSLFSMVFGDVIGHGILHSPGAILAMAAFKTKQTHDPRGVQESINRLLLNFPGIINKCLCLSLLFKKNGIVEFCGRIESMNVLRKKGGMLEPLALESHGEILGVSSKLKYTKKTEFKMRYEDILVLRTDGHIYDDSTDDKTLVMVTRKRKTKFKENR